jgi:hypothetical protein
VGQWAAVSEPESIYVKIDDDVVSPLLDTKTILREAEHLTITVNLRYA